MKNFIRRILGFSRSRRAGMCLLVELGKLANVFEDVESWFD